MAEDRKRAQFKVERACTIDINDAVRLEYDAETDTVVFSDGEDEPLFQMTFDAFEDLFGTAKAERDRIRTLEAAAAKK